MVSTHRPDQAVLAHALVADLQSHGRPGARTGRRGVNPDRCRAVGGKLDAPLPNHPGSRYTNYLQTAADIDAWRAGAGINYYVFTWLGTGLAYTYLQQQGDTADGGTQDLYAHRITLRVALATPRPDWIRF
jgi:hypothetical protein